MLYVLFVSHWIASPQRAVYPALAAA